MSRERLQKIIAAAGITSRRKAEDLIRAGRVTVNGHRAELGASAGPADEVAVDGRPVKRVTRRVTFMLNKPPGYLSTVSDPHGRRTVLDLLPAEPGLHPVGRLDLDSEGLLLVTTDGHLTQRVTHPRYGKDKEYRVWCTGGTPDARVLQQLREGVELDDGPARVVSIARAPGGARLVIREGRKRQVRRMFSHVGCEVERLLRLRVGSVRLGDLETGQWRRLSGAEQDRLLR